MVRRRDARLFDYGGVSIRIHGWAVGHFDGLIPREFGRFWAATTFGSDSRSVANVELPPYFLNHYPLRGYTYLIR